MPDPGDLSLADKTFRWIWRTLGSSAEPLADLMASAHNAKSNRFVSRFLEPRSYAADLFADGTAERLHELLDRHPAGVFWLFPPNSDIERAISFVLRNNIPVVMLVPRGSQPWRPPLDLRSSGQLEVSPAPGLLTGSARTPAAVALAAQHPPPMVAVRIVP